MNNEIILVSISPDSNRSRQKKSEGDLEMECFSRNARERLRVTVALRLSWGELRAIPLIAVVVDPRRNDLLRQLITGVAQSRVAIADQPRTNYPVHHVPVIVSVKPLA